MPNKIIIAYRTRLVPDLMPDLNNLQPPANYKSDEALAKWREEQGKKLEATCLAQPYTATFDEVHAIDIRTDGSETEGEKKTWKYREVGGDKPMISAAMRSWLLKRYPKAWEYNTHPVRSGSPEAIFIGFNPRLFLKIMGIECSMPRYQPKDSNGKTSGDDMYMLPLSMWFSNSDHRDIEEAVKPSDYKMLDWQLVLKGRGLHEKYAGWNGPGVDLGADLKISIDLAAQLGMLVRDS